MAGGRVSTPAAGAAAAAAAAASAAAQNLPHALHHNNSNHDAGSSNGSADVAVRLVEDDDVEANKILPVTASRTASWWASAFHNVTAMVGAGVLGLPYTFTYLGWAAGIIVMILSTIISWYTFWQLVHMHEVSDDDAAAPPPAAAAGKAAIDDDDNNNNKDAEAATAAARSRRPPHRLNRYHELTRYAWGRARGSWALLPFQCAVLVGLGVTYTVTGGSSLFYFCRRLGLAPAVTKTGWIAVFGAAEILLVQLPSFNHLTFISLMGAVMSFGYSLIAVVLSALHGAGRAARGEAPPSYSIGAPGDGPAQLAFGIFNAVSTIAFSYGGHNVALEIQSTLPDPPPTTTKAMMRGVNIAYVATVLCYFSVALTGYAVFGNAVADNVLVSVREPVVVVAIADLFVVFHVIASYQVYTFPMVDMILQALWKRGVRFNRLSGGALRAFYVCCTTFVAALIPFFGDLMGLVGALGVTPTTFLLPAVLWLYLKRPKLTSPAGLANIAIIVICGLVGVLGTVGSLQLIILHASRYSLFS